MEGESQQPALSTARQERRNVQERPATLAAADDYHLAGLLDHE
jgi:hypothetical protein